MPGPSPHAGARLWARRLAAALALLGLTAAAARAGAYPDRPITMVVPLAAGGSTDVIGRIVAAGMGTALGQPVVVENTSGAGGTIGVARVARADPDGYTIGIGQWGTNMASGAIYPLSFDLLNDLTPIGLIATQPFMVVARKTMPANDLPALIAWLKAHAATALEGNSGVGTPSHVGGIMFQKAAGVQITMVPYRSAGQSLQALLAGQLDVMLDTPALSLPQVRAGTEKAYAVTADTRLAMAPEIPTTAEAGLPGFTFSFWHALWAPKSTPQPIVDRLNAALRQTLADPATRKKLVDLAQEIFPPDQQSPAALYAFHKAEIEKWWPIIKAAGIKAE